MKYKLLTFWIFIFLTMTACSGVDKIAIETATNTASPQVQEILPTQTTESSTPTPLGISSEDTTFDEPEKPLSECTLVSSLEEPSPEYADLFAVKADDWSIGPENAPVTIIEYGDYQ